MTTLILLVVFLTVAALLVRERLWGAMVMFLDVLAAATIATAWYEPLAAVGQPFFRLIEPLPQFVDLLAAWGIFAVVLGVLRLVTDLVSRTRVAFPPLVDWGGAVLVAALTAWVMVAFTATTLHMAPLPRETVQPTPSASMFFGLAPDRKWLQWVRGGTMVGPFAAGGGRVFDEGADFVLRYADRRAGNAAAFSGGGASEGGAAASGSAP